MRWHRPVFGTVGIVAVLFGVSLLFVPGVKTVGPVQQGLSYVEDVGTTRALLVTGGGLIGYLLVGLRSPDRSEGAVDRFDADQASERAKSTDGVAGAQFDHQVQTAIEDGSESFAIVREQLQRTAVSVYVDAVGCTDEQAWHAIETGTWCSDPLAAAFLADSGQSTPLGAQLRLVVFPRRERRRRIERTVAVIEQVQRR